MPFQPVNPLHLTVNDYFETVTEAEAFAVGPVALPGWVLAAKGSESDPLDEVVRLYVVQEDRSLREAGGNTSAVSPDATTVPLGQTITVKGSPIGNYNVDDVIAATESVYNVLSNMLRKVIAPVYNAPAYTISTATALTQETGTAVTASVASVFSQNHAGTLTNFQLLRDATSISSGSSLVTPVSVPVTFGDTAIQVRGIIDYGQGPVLNNSVGDPDDTGRIAAGSITSNILTFTGRRAFFSGSTTTAVLPSNSALVRALPQKTLNPVNGGTYTVNAASGARAVSFAYPATLNNVSLVSYVESGNANYTDLFVLNTVSVEGASGATAIDYKVYTWLLDVASGASMTFTVKL
jgi:hypothetical protein